MLFLPKYRFLARGISASAFGFLAIASAGCGSGALGGSAATSTPTAVSSSAQLGYFWNPSDKTLRPVVGVPGSSRVGQSVTPAGAYVGGAASSASGFALLQLADGSLDVMALPSGQPTHLVAVLAAGETLRFSPSGRTAIAFLPGTQTIAVVTGIGSNPLLTTLNAAAGIADAAVNDTGNVAVATGSSPGIAIRLLRATGSTQLATAGAVGGLAFAGSDDLVFADSAANTLTVIHNASSAPSPQQVSTSGLLQSPVALGTSPDGHWAVIANGGGNKVVRVDLTAQTAPLAIACACTPTNVETLTGGGSFRVTGPGTGAMWAVEADAATPRAFFIPALLGVTGPVKQ